MVEDRNMVDGSGKGVEGAAYGGFFGGGGREMNVLRVGARRRGEILGIQRMFAPYG